MIGLNAVNDSSTTRLKAPTHHKTHKFASGLKDRFYSTGVSGSMQQHQNVENKKKAAKAGLRTAREIHQANVEKELEDDARQLAELEEKLVEVCYCSSIYIFYSLSTLLATRFADRNKSGRSERQPESWLGCTIRRLW